MYQVVFYEDDKGYSEVRSFIEEFQNKTDKDSKVNYSKIYAYINELQKYGPVLREPFAKHLKGRIWELRPLRNRILYAYVENNQIILLTHFAKKTVKTPRRELERAERCLDRYLKEGRK